MSSLKEQIHNYITKDYIIMPAGNHYTEIEGWYIKHLEEGKQKGYTPLIINSEHNFSYIFNYTSYEEAEEKRKEKIEHAKKINTTQFFEKRAKSEMETEDEEYQELLESFFHTDYININDFLLDEFISFTSEDNTTQEVILAKIPTNKPWELAAWIPMGGWNKCPEPDVQAAIFQNWFEKYRAFPAAVSSDTWEFYVECPPESEEEAIELAKEHFIFCDDKIFQGEAGNIADLAGELLNAHIWYFWWD